jgi:hypothetical protein
MHEKSLTQEAKSRIPNVAKDAEVVTNLAENPAENSQEEAH